MNRQLSEDRLRLVLTNFGLDGTLSNFSPLGRGHINDTYLIEITLAQRTEKYTLQRINTHVFRQPELMMANWEMVIGHLQLKLSQQNRSKLQQQSLRLVPTRDGGSFFRSPEGEYWRAYHFVDHCHTIETATTPEQAFEAGQAFGLFQRLVVDLSPAVLHETIPFFHHTPRRFADFLAAVERAQPERKSRAAAAIAFALERQPMVGLVAEGLASGYLPLRVTHNDTKINNVLFDDATGKAICVIDLDTTMPGSPLYDFGDLVRTATCPAAEDETDLTLINLNIELFRAVAEGYLSQTADILTPAEKERLIAAGNLITFTIALRFLTDYLDGDIYFKVSRPDHNLDRARAQFQLLKSMEQQAKEMAQNLHKILGGQS